MDKWAKDKLARSPGENGGGQDAQKIFTHEHKNKKTYFTKLNRSIQNINIYLVYTGCFCMQHNKVSVSSEIYNMASPASSKCSVQSTEICTGLSWLGIVQTGSSERRN
jgi:hypothetical protein